MGFADDDRLVRAAVEGGFDQPLEGGGLLLDAAYRSAAQDGAPVYVESLY